MNEESPEPGRWWLRYAGALAVVVVLGGLAWFLTRPGDEEPTQAAAPATSTRAPVVTTGPAAPLPSVTEVPLAAGSPDASRPAKGTPTLVEDLSVGDCLWDPVPRADQALGYAANTVPCTSAHTAEVYGVYDVPDQPYFGQEGQVTQGSPGDVDLNCPDPAPMQARHPGETLRLALFYPTERSWKDGARTAACVASFETSSGVFGYRGRL